MDIGPVAVAELDRHVDRVAIEVDVGHGRADAHLDAGMARVEIRQPRDQPLGRKGRVGAQPQCARAGVLEQVLGGTSNGGEGRHDLVGEGAADPGEAHAVALAAQQLDPEVGFEHGDLPAHG